ncbi:MAG: hypothetical protein NZ866_01190, partial [Patescibacteria group bacterium]|nr:hypothetical protein [Patescibacteria group bacterium]
MKKNILLIIGVILVIVIIGGSIYFINLNKNNIGNWVNQNQVNQSQDNFILIDITSIGYYQNNIGFVANTNKGN